MRVIHCKDLAVLWIHNKNRNILCSHLSFKLFAFLLNYSLGFTINCSNETITILWLFHLSLHIEVFAHIRIGSSILSIQERIVTTFYSTYSFISTNNESQHVTCKLVIWIVSLIFFFKSDTYNIWELSCSLVRLIILNLIVGQLLTNNLILRIFLCKVSSHLLSTDTKVLGQSLTGCFFLCLKLNYVLRLNYQIVNHSTCRKNRAIAVIYIASFIWNRYTFIALLTKDFLVVIVALTNVVIYNCAYDKCKKECKSYKQKEKMPTHPLYKNLSLFLLPSLCHI